MKDLSVIIPNRNSPFTTRTIEDLLEKSVTDIEIIVNVDENWPDPLLEDKRVTYIHPSSPRGMRWGINSGIALAKGKYVMKTDDHCMFAEGFDKVLIENHHEDNWVQIPRRYSLDAENWQINRGRPHRDGVFHPLAVEAADARLARGRRRHRGHLSGARPEQGGDGPDDPSRGRRGADVQRLHLSEEAAVSGERALT